MKVLERLKSRKACESHQLFEKEKTVTQCLCENIFGGRRSRINYLGGVFILECVVFSEAGSYHRTQEQANEDAIVSMTNDSVAVVVACDGAGSLSAGGIAAKLASETVAKELLLTFDELYCSDSASARWNLAKAVTACLSSYGEQHNLATSDLACTIVAAAMDTEGRCICFHLGDGIIFRRKTDSISWDSVSSPRNGLTKNTTYLTMNCNLWHYLQYYRWKDPKTESILLLTDGASEHLVRRGRDYEWRLMRKCQSNTTNIKKFLESIDPHDDYSCGMIIRK